MTTWLIGPIKSPVLIWGDVRSGHVHQCQFCPLPLLTGERAGFCCDKDGQFLNSIPPLPPLPPEYNVFLLDLNISSKSQVLNLIFSFACLETTHQFPEI